MISPFGVQHTISKAKWSSKQEGGTTYTTQTKTPLMVRRGNPTGMAGDAKRKKGVNWGRERQTRTFAHKGDSLIGIAESQHNAKKAGQVTSVFVTRKKRGQGHAGKMLHAMQENRPKVHFEAPAERSDLGEKLTRKMDPANKVKRRAITADAMDGNFALGYQKFKENHKTIARRSTRRFPRTKIGLGIAAGTAAAGVGAHELNNR